MTPKRRILFVIFAFVAFTLGSFIWFVATWDPSKEEPVTWLDPAQSEDLPA
ncbi:MAG: hypothetical protein AAF922_16385 [Pseudomonadota bacterium]